jgi:hypothetical protein
MTTSAEQRTANRTAAIEGDIVAIDFATANATTLDLADPQLLGTKCADGWKWQMWVSVACVYKFALPSSTTDVLTTTRSTTTTAGGAAQGMALAAGEKIEFFFRTKKSLSEGAAGAEVGLCTQLSIRGDAATGVVRIARVSQDDS